MEQNCHFSFPESGHAIPEPMQGEKSEEKAVKTGRFVICNASERQLSNKTTYIVSFSAMAIIEFLSRESLVDI